MVLSTTGTLHIFLLLSLPSLLFSLQILGQDFPGFIDKVNPLILCSALYILLFPNTGHMWAFIMWQVVGHFILKETYTLFSSVSLHQNYEQYSIIIWLWKTSGCWAGHRDWCPSLFIAPLADVLRKWWMTQESLMRSWDEHLEAIIFGNGMSNGWNGFSRSKYLLFPVHKWESHLGEQVTLLKRKILLKQT